MTCNDTGLIMCSEHVLRRSLAKKSPYLKCPFSGINGRPVNGPMRNGQYESEMNTKLERNHDVFVILVTSQEPPASLW